MIVIDDDPDQLDVLGLVLRESGYETETYADAHAALLRIHEAPPALVITDLTMPAFSGLDVLKAIRARFAITDVPIIVLSGLGEEDTIVECFSAGASDYLTKPITVGELRAKAAVLIKRAGATQPRALAGEALSVGSGVEFPDNGQFGRYRILQRLGAGGMGVIYKAQAPDGAIVALKVLTPELSRDTALLKRFFREAQHLKSIRHPNVVAFHDLGFVGNTYYIVMDFVDGDPLDTHYEAVLPLEEVRASVIGRQIALALDALGNAGMVHRDLKPANVMVTQDDNIMLIDFGLTQHQQDERLTDVNLLVGTPHFIAPERLTGAKAEVDIRADLYALGVILFWLLAGRLPFDDGTSFEVMRDHASTPAPLLSSLNPEVSPWMESVVEKLLAKRPEARFQTPAEVVEALAQVARLANARSPTAELRV